MLDQILTGKQPAPRRTILYGVEGVGKSTWASHAPGAIFVPTEDGLGDIDCEKFPHVQTLEAFECCINALYNEKHDYKTVVIDSLDRLELLIHAEVAAEKGFDTIEEIGYGKGYGPAVRKWLDVIYAVEMLRKERGMHIVMIAHATIQRFDSPESEAYDRYVPRLHKSALPLLIEWADEVFFACYRVALATEDSGFGKDRVRARGITDRIIRTTERPFCCAKSRIKLPSEDIEMDWGVYQAAFNGATLEEKK